MTRSHRTAGVRLDRTVLAPRLATLAATLGRPSPAVDDPGEAVSRLVDASDRAEVWLALAVLSGRLPDESTVVETVRAAEFDPTALLAAAEAEATDLSVARTVRVESERVLVDVAHTASTTLMTGIQRVVRETVRRWQRDHDVLTVSWTAEWDALRTLTPAEADRIAHAKAADEDETVRGTQEIVVPWRSRYVLPEVALDTPRVARMRALARFSGNAFAAIGYDLIPLTTGETTAPAMPGAFAGATTVMRYAEHVTPISEASAVEYRGWRTTLAATGIQGPRITAVELPVESVAVSDAAMEATAERLLVGGLPMVLVVGSHEPRKNHLAVLHAAEVLWREGQRFSLTFVGGNSWGSEEFSAQLLDLQRADRPVESISKVSEDLLWAAYRLARFTVFPSFNEGFGLPVAESLSVGTPAITSDFGSMAEIAALGGALTVDPRSDVSIRDAMRRLLADDDLRARLSEAALGRPRRSWDEYAKGVWAHLGTAPTTSDSGS
ncbi:glycosyltransferase family 1 protein [Xylanimonas allomyrinae]|uniref:Glycosyltransferase family 1 protein n=1 Tax=Xylanimonas allomyrinae TaxID=2509459 RepID=A0A4P6EM02_9MICO|nr:glycosyltransferase family 1 protein [Xylanimonas allomyrinae]QAY63405.1 glycosyltransferase family 1 protein [Xylanimonas allomyrinae]